MFWLRGKSRVKACLRSSFATFYDSQSGKHVELPGSDVIRVHESCKPKSLTHLLTLAIMEPTTLSIEVDQETRSWMEGLRKHKQPKLSVKVKSLDDLPILSDFDFAPAAHFDVELDRSSEKGSHSASEALNIIPKLVEIGVQPSVNIFAKIGPENDMFLFSDTIASMADAGATHIALHTCSAAYEGCEDFIEELVDEVFNLDVEGMPMSYRLALSCDSAPLVQAAIRLGVTSFVSHTPEGFDPKNAMHTPGTALAIPIIRATALAEGKGEFLGVRDNFLAAENEAKRLIAESGAFG